MYKNYKIISLIWILVICLCIGVCLFLNNKQYLYLKKDSLILEYGKTVSEDVKEYLDLTKLNDNERLNVLNNTNYTNNFEKESDTGYFKTGNYFITLSYFDEIKKIKVTIKDTISPEVIVSDKIEIIQGTDLATIDFKSFIEIKDLAKLKEPIFNLDNININAIGEYLASVTVEDVHQNKTVTDFKVKIISNNIEKEDVDTFQSDTNLKKSHETTDVNDYKDNNSNKNNSSNNQSNNTNINPPTNNETQEEIPPVKKKKFWAKCGCGYYLESLISIDDAINKLFANGHGNGNNGLSDNGDCYHYSYGAYEYYE